MKNGADVIFIGNYKGGVGKTTSVLNLAHYFSASGKKVLVMDLDPQSSLSELLVKNSGNSLMKLEEERTLNYVFDLQISRIKKYNSIELKFEDNIIQNYKNEYDFIASSLFYREDVGLDELAIQMEDNIEYLSILKNYIDEILTIRTYDYILIDCPPSNNLITRSAFLLSDYYIIPTILDGVSSNGVAHYINTVNKTYNMYCNEGKDSMLSKHYFGNKAMLIGVFCTFIRGQVNYDSAIQELKDTLNSRVNEEEVYIFSEEINNYIDIARSTEGGEVSKVRKDYQVLSNSVLSRIDSLKTSV